MKLGKHLKLGVWVGLTLCCLLLFAQQHATAPQLHLDSDHDGLNDALEHALLVQFMPKFMIGQHDCSFRPAEFQAGSLTPRVEAANGTIYGQAFPLKEKNDNTVLVELHYYHLWGTDCGRHGHPLDTEHVAVLIHASDTHLQGANWKALYWYAAAHENTVCDVSQIARASTLHAEDHGATVWISPGKHASYLNCTLCERGCGADHCEEMTQLAPLTLINLGEPGFPMDGSDFISSNAWPLEYKMSNSNFPATAIARVNRLPATDIAWFNPGRHPAQGIIARSSSTEQAIAISGADASVAISVASDSAGGALSRTSDATDAALSYASSGTGNALQTSYKHTGRAIGASARNVGKALHITPKPRQPRPHRSE